MTPSLAALLAAAWTLIVLLGVWSVVGPYLRDRKRAEGVDRARVAQGKGCPDCRSTTSAGRRSETPGAYDPSQIRGGGPT